jgi:hypothetical protein
MKSLGLIVLSSLALAACSSPVNPTLIATINSPASLAADHLPANPFDWQVITSFVDKAHSSMATLYGNDTAVQYARSNSGHEYPAGSQLALITWTQREDPRWFGANVPDHLQSVEFLAVSQALMPAGSAQPKLVPSYSYQRFEGSPLKSAASWNSTVPDSRASFLLSLQPSFFP